MKSGLIGANRLEATRALSVGNVIWQQVPRQ